MAAGARFWAFTTIFTYLCIGEVMNIYELYGDSMQHFALSQVNL